MILFYVVAFLSILYCFVILNYWMSWKQIPVFEAATLQPAISFSVVIPARNEEQNIATLIEDIQKQNYPVQLFELIIVDDHSTDNTATIIKNYPGIKFVQLSGLQINSYKKKAIETGISVAANEWIVTTDADCRVSPQWLSILAAFIEEKKPVLVAGPVFMSYDNKAFQIFQSLDFLMLQGITGAAVHHKMHSMGNGANLAYQKKIFIEVGGFAGIDQIASGDDMLLVHKMRLKYPEGISYLKSSQAIVSTGAEKTWKAFFSQRIRWASKARKYQDKKLFPILLMVYLFNVSFFVLLIAGFWRFEYWFVLIAMLFIKTLIELPFFISVARFFNQTNLIKSFILFQPLHIFYTVCSGFLGQLGRYEWKGRKVQ
ncbi:MAG TPA: glycosyltransferase [Chitinophagaceae bacterium]|nr:glycosyltransferase [Chitinophagaceae bacterium]